MSSAPSAPARPARRTTAGAVVASLRPAEWTKNLFVFAGVVFSGRFEDLDPILSSVVVFAAFCAVSSAGYLFNDVRDAALDRLHPTKRTRPIAAGELSPRTGLALAAVLAVAGLGAAGAIGLETLGAVAAYGVVTVAYSLVLKHVVIVDVMTIGACFLLRVLAGAVTVDVDVSEWLIVCTGMLALFLGFTKRRQEAASELRAGGSTRPVLEHYSMPFLDQMVALVSTGTVISYVIYATGSPLVGGRMLWTAPMVTYGIFRYLYLIYDRSDQRDAATLVTRDPGMIAAAIAWAGTVLALLYL
jgi:4-hydroxybenzoate polyprenyltransferase